MEITKDYLLLHGGVDIGTQYYHQNPTPWSQRPDDERDAWEFREVLKAVSVRKPIVGICRGAQLLCIVAGGKLWQHSEGHTSEHGLEFLFKGQRGKIDHAPACHHQIMDLSSIKDGVEVIAWCPFPTKVYYQSQQSTLLARAPEIVYFPSLKAVAIQAHPEWADDKSEFKLFVRKVIKDKLKLEGVV